MLFFVVNVVVLFLTTTSDNFGQLHEEGVMNCCHWLSMLSCFIYDNEGQLWGSYLSNYFYNLPNIK